MRDYDERRPLRGSSCFAECRDPQGQTTRLKVKQRLARFNTSCEMGGAPLHPNRMQRGRLIQSPLARGAEFPQSLPQRLRGHSDPQTPRRTAADFGPRCDQHAFASSYQAPHAARSDRAVGKAKRLKATGGHYVRFQHEINPREQRGRCGGLGCIGGVERLQIVTDQADVGK